MKYSFLEKMACPFDKSELKLQVFAEEALDVREGLLTCPTCQRYYPIIFGIPIMSPDEYREQKLEYPVLQRWGVDVAKISGFAANVPGQLEKNPD